MSAFILIIIANLIVSLISFIGVFALAVKKEFLEKISLFLVALSAGTLMGGSFLHLLPEASERLKGDGLFLPVLVSFIIFFLIEKIFHWRHCHQGECSVHSFGYLNLIGDGVHNFIDGLIIAATFLVDVKLGIATTVAVSLHEIPQEIGDFGVLIYSGFKKSKALLLNFIVSLTAIIGGITGYFLSLKNEELIIYLLPFAAGGFIYIATSDLIPEIRKEKEVKKSCFLFLYFIIGIVIVYFADFFA